MKKKKSKWKGINKFVKTTKTTDGRIHFGLQLETLSGPSHVWDDSGVAEIDRKFCIKRIERMLDEIMIEKLRANSTGYGGKIANKFEYEVLYTTLVPVGEIYIITHPLTGSEIYHEVK